MKLLEKTVTYPIAALVILTIVVPFTFMEGWMLSLVWEWHITQPFGIQPLTYLQATSIITALAFWRAIFPRYRMNPKDDDTKTGLLLIASTFLAFVVAWLIHLIQLW